MADYYIENGLYVFTEQYHLKRGYCCKSACRHCPFGFNSEKKAIKCDNKTKQKSNKQEKEKSK